MNNKIATVVNFARSQLDLHKHLPGDSILGMVLKKREWADFVEEAERMSAVNAELWARCKQLLKHGLSSARVIRDAQAAIARAEQPNTNPESKT